MIRDRRHELDRRSQPSTDRESVRGATEPETPRPVDQQRTFTDRRFSATPFRESKAHIIRTAIERTGRPGACPLCNHELTWGPPVERGNGCHREVRCATCHRSIVVDNVF